MTLAALTWLTSLALSSAYQPAPVQQPSLEQLLSEVATCDVDREYERARSFVLAYPVDPTGSPPRAPLASRCKDILLRDNVQVSFMAYLYRYALADALVRRDFTAGDPANLASVAALRQPQPLLAPATDSERRSARALHAAQVYARVEARDAAMGECIVRTDPQAARQWLLTVPGSRQDMETAQAIIPAFQACVKRTGGGPDFDPSVVRGPVALNYYRLAVASKQAGAGQ
jgi:hypothetical protein